MSDPREPIEGGAPPADDNLDIDIDDLDTGIEPDEELDTQPDDDDYREPEPEPAPRREMREGRRDRQAAHWRDQFHEAERRNQEYERRLAALEGGQRQPQVDPQQQQRALQEQLRNIAMQDPENMVMGIYGLLSQQMQQGLTVTALQNNERIDLDKFERIQRDEPQARRLAKNVEAEVQNLRAQGIYSINREVVYERELGKMIREQARERGARQRDRGARNVARHTTRPLSGRGDVPSDNRGRRGSEGSLAADIERLKNMSIEDL